MASDRNDRNGEADDGLCWHAPTEPPFRLAGLAWFERDRTYRRLPLSPPCPLPESVDQLANCTAGAQIQFRTDSRRLTVRVQLAGAANMNHMPATGQCGFDCYVGPPKRQRYCNTTKYDHRQTSYEYAMFDLPTRERRNVTLNFPLYQGVSEVWVGLDSGANVEAPPAYDGDTPIVVYGTSITQGGCASRPGMAYTNILSRRLNREFVNLGFSGSGRGEPEVARTIATIPDAACFVLDYEANAGQGRLEDTLGEFLDVLRDAHPTVPILVVSRIRFARESFCGDAVAERLKWRDFQRHTVDRRRAAGDGRIFFLDGSELLPGENFDECTVDGAHPTDLGFWHMARGLVPSIEAILGT